jgi:hypothetical protein
MSLHSLPIPFHITPARRKYLRAVLVWLGLMALLTPWRGVSYNQDPVHPKVWTSGGTFDLMLRVPPSLLEMFPVDVEELLHSPVSPIFLPPRPIGDFKAAVRWPLQPRNHHDIVELEWNWFAIEIWLGAVLTGLVFAPPIHGRRDAFASREDPDLLLTTARSMAWTLIVVAPCWILLAMSVFLFATSVEIEWFTLGMLGLGCGAGVAVGSSNYRAAVSSTESKATKGAEEV